MWLRWQLRCGAGALQAGGAGEATAMRTGEWPHDSRAVRGRGARAQHRHRHQSIAPPTRAAGRGVVEVEAVAVWCVMGRVVGGGIGILVGHAEGRASPRPFVSFSGSPYPLDLCTPATPNTHLPAHCGMLSPISQHQQTAIAINPWQWRVGQ